MTTRDDYNCETEKIMRQMRRSIMAAGPQEESRAVSDWLREEEPERWARYYHQRLPEGAERMRRSRKP